MACMIVLPYPKRMLSAFDITAATYDANRSLLIPCYDNLNLSGTRPSYLTNGVL